MILVVGSNKHTTSEYAQQQGLGTSSLFTGTEFAPVCHSSFADCTTLDQYFDQFDQIIWANSPASEFNSHKEYFETVFALKRQGVVVQDDPYHLRQLHNMSNKENSIVFLGCSHTHGTGLDNSEENYVNLVSKHFGLNPINLAQPGKSNFRSFEQFNQLAFNKNQTVILQLTDVTRLKYFDQDQPTALISEKQLQNITNRSYFDVYNDKQLVYMLQTHLNYIINHARSIGLKFVFFNMGGNNDPGHSDKFKKFIEYYLLDYPEYVPGLITKNVDRGNDGYHFGPKSHAIWAQDIIKKIETLYQ